MQLFSSQQCSFYPVQLFFWKMCKHHNVQRLSYVRNPRSLMEGTETLCREDIGVLLESPNPLWLSENANENWIVDFACSATPRARGYKEATDASTLRSRKRVPGNQRYIVYCCTPKVLYNHMGGLFSTTTSVQHLHGWCDGSHRTTVPVRSPHTSYRWRGERVIEPIKWMGIIRRPW